MFVLRGWSPRRWLVAALAALGTVLLIGLPTVLIPNPVFGREIPMTWWAWPTLLVAAALSGLLTATYVRQPNLSGLEEDDGTKSGMVGGVLTFFAVGCPVCNKVVLVALGSAGAMQWFAPLQPVLAVAAVAALAWALHVRLRGERACALTPAVSTAP
ncbi:hypothetical protein GA707_02220 [Nostocoides sp. F2B08]|nr:hypothetical protein GA707_02220 [Tetrasphaera sp. F2B08]